MKETIFRQVALYTAIAAFSALIDKSRPGSAQRASFLPPFAASKQQL